MNRIHDILLGLNSLSVFRGILNRSVIKSYIKLISSLSSAPENFLNSYGEFFSLLAERNITDNLARYITETVLFDDNVFSTACAGGKYNKMSDNVLYAVKNDVNTIYELSLLNSDDIFNEYKYKNDIADIISSLPKWSTGEPAEGFKNGVDFNKLINFYKENGFGIFARYKAFIWRDSDIKPVCHPDKITVDSFIGYERQRNQILENTKAFLNNKPCNNCLLYGDMGTGKSSTVKAIGNMFRKKGLRIVEMPKERLMDFPLLIDKIALNPMKFIIFVDDLSFQHQDKNYTSLKAVLEGGLAAKPDNALIYATSNRRHLIKESWADRDTDDINRRDNMQESLSLSDRFGLSVYFSNPDKYEYLKIVKSLSHRAGIKLEENELSILAERFALKKGGRSPRCAKQFVESLGGEKI